MIGSPKTTRNLVAVVMLILAVVNLVSVFAVVEAPDTPPVPAAEAEEVESPAETELIRGVGGLTTPAGLGVLFTSIGLAGMAIGLLMNRRWEVGAMFFLGADIFFKILNIISQLTILEFTDPNILLAIGLIVVESILIVLLFNAWQRSDPSKEVAPQAQRNEG